RAQEGGGAVTEWGGPPAEPRARADRSSAGPARASARFHEQAMPGLRHPEAQFAQALQMQVEGLAGVGERFGQGIAAGDDLREVGEVDREDRLGRPVTDRENVTHVLVESLLHSPS